MKDRLRDKTKSRMWLSVVSLCAAIFFLTVGSSSAEAGPLLDWLFQRNRSQGYAGAAAGNSFGAYGRGEAGYGRPYTSNYAQNAYQANRYGNQFGGTASMHGGYGNTNQSFYRGGQTSGFPKCGLFGRGCSLFGNRNGSVLSSNTNQAGSQLAGRQWNNKQSNQYGQTTAYAGTATVQGGSCPVGCQRGWCEQTVLRYMPQIAYRTDYQPVPVTTYKTTTTINPANGLPRTCTRPCTTYDWQARRVPYTTYRPVYTTVPVTDDCGCNANTGNANLGGYANPNAGYASPNAGYASPNAGYASPNAFNSNAASIAPQLPQSSEWRAVPYAGTNYAPNQFQPNRVQANRVFRSAPVAANSGWVAVSGGCQDCQNNTAGHQHGFSAGGMSASGFGGTVAGYAPNNPGVLPPAPRTTPWRPVDRFSDSYTSSSGFRGDTPRPSPWRRVSRESDWRSVEEDSADRRDGYRRDFESSSQSTGGYSNAEVDADIPWNPVPPNRTRSLGTVPRPTVLGNEANERPRLDPRVHSYRGNGFDYETEPLIPEADRRRTRVLVPVPKSIPQIPEVTPQSVEPLYHSDPRSLGDRVQANVGRPSYQINEPTSAYSGTGADVIDPPSVEEQLFGTPGTSASGGEFHSTNENFETRRKTGYRTRAIHDNMRGGRRSDQDKTAQDNSPTENETKDTRWTTRSQENNNSLSRYAAVDITWSGIGRNDTDRRRWLANNETANSRSSQSPSNKID